MLSDRDQLLSAEHVDNMIKLGGMGRLMPLSPLMHGAGLLTAARFLERENRKDSSDISSTFR